MPTIKPRVNVTLKPEDYALLSTLARQQKRSRADLLRDLFETIRPVLERVAVVSEAAQRAQSTAKQGLIESAEKAEAELQPMVQKALGQFDLFLAEVQQQTEGRAESQPPQAAAADRTPVPVITGVRSRKPVDKSPGKRVGKGGRRQVSKVGKGGRRVKT